MDRLELPIRTNSNSTRNQVDEEPLCGCATCKSLFILFIYLELNPDKTKFLILGTRQQLEKVITSHLVVGESRINPSTKVKNLGSWFDSNLDMLTVIQGIYT